MSALARTVVFASLLFLSVTAVGQDSTPAPGDLVRITVYGQPDLTTVARIAENNLISFPFVGQVLVGGRPVEETQRTIASELEQRGIVRNAQVNVLVEEAGDRGKYVTVLGEVLKPGRFPLGGASNPFGNELVELLASAGGTRDSAGSTVLVMRATAGDKRETIRLDLGKLLRGDNFDDNNPELQEGDIVVVPEADVFYVYGQVRSPGRYPIERDMKVMHALSIAGGITDRGNEKDLELMRGEGDSPRKKALLSDEVQPGDVIYVSERFF